VTIETIFRVSYSDTDRMGFMHHSNYFKYFETARWELFRNIGIPYTEIEEEGIILPVTESAVKYIYPALYDQEIKIATRIKSFRGARIEFEYRSINEAGAFINEASITVACVNKSTGKACLPSKKMVNTLKAFINK
jgi:acyl-CoA thioester hydrolase